MENKCIYRLLDKNGAASLCGLPAPFIVKGGSYCEEHAMSARAGKTSD